MKRTTCIALLVFGACVRREPARPVLPSPLEKSGSPPHELGRSVLEEPGAAGLNAQTESQAVTAAAEQITNVTLPPPTLVRPSPPATGLANLAEAAEGTTPSRRASLALAQRAREKWQNREPEAAVAELRSALQLWGGNPYALYYLGILSLEQGRYGEAAAQAQRAAALWKQNPFWQARAYLLLSEARQRLGDAAGAVEARRRALDLDPNAELR